MMKKREEELLKAIQGLSEKTEGFTNPRLILIGGYALKAFIKFSRFTSQVIRKMFKAAAGWISYVLMACAFTVQYLYLCVKKRMDQREVEGYV
jgi:hypothetical protein